METIRIKDKELFKRVKMRALEEDKTLWEVVEKALATYLQPVKTE